MLRFADLSKLRMKAFQPLRIAFFLAGIIACNSPAHEDPDQIIRSFVMNYSERTSLSYRGSYHMKFFSEPSDTNKWEVKVDLIRDSGDTLLGGMIWIEADSIIRYWNKRRVCLIDQRNQKITEYPAWKTFPIEGNTVGECISVYFLKPEKLLDLWQDTSYEHSLVIDSIFSSKYWLVNFNIPADDFLSGGWKRVWLDRQYLSLVRTYSSYDMKGENQYRERRIDEVFFDQVDSAALAARFDAYLKDYEVEIYEPPKDSELAPLSEGEPFPSVLGWSYNLKDTLDLEEVDARLVVLDFWYMDCHPCIMAIPHLNEVVGKYDREDLAIIGVNPFNNNEKDLGRLPNFLEHNPIDYPFVFVDRDMAANARVRGYPTFYVLDEDRKVLYSGVGYSENMASRLDSVLGEYLDQQ